MDWQAIDSAPKDGTRVLLTDGKFVATGAWREWSGFHNMLTSRPEYVTEYRWDIDGERGDECPWANDYMGDVILWMPLPTPQLFAFTEETCPGHIASDDPRVCAHCGTHIDSMRPPDDELPSP